MRLDNQYAQFSWAGSVVQPSPLLSPSLLLLNTALAEELGIELSQEQWRDLVSGHWLAEGMVPFAQVYAGHQFGGYSPQLGDGRAMLLGEVIALNGQRWDLNLKGGGKTPYSRFGDGRAVLRSSLREYLASEALFHLGIATTRALALVTSKQPVYRETVEAGAAVLRAAPSHLRFGHFEYFYHSGKAEHIPTLLDYLIDTQWPDLTKDAAGYGALFARVVEKTATVIAQWQLVGFCHGVLNTDNMSMLGLTLDYGPYGFLDAYDPDHICNHSDTGGRYAYDQQPAVGYWNLQRLAQSLSGVVELADLQGALAKYERQLMTAYSEGMRQKLGLNGWEDADPALFSAMFSLMQAHKVDYTCWFRRLAGLTAKGDIPADLAVLLPNIELFSAWFAQYQARLSREAIEPAERERLMNSVNPKYILRNHLAQQAIVMAEQGDLSEADTLLMLLARPFDEQPEFEAYAQPAPAWACDLEISCSS